MRAYTVIFSALVLFFDLSVIEGGYLITTPRKWASGTDTQICVTKTNGQTFTVDDELILTYDPMSLDPYSPLSATLLKLPVGESSTCLSTDVPEDDDGGYGKVEFTGTIGGEKVHDTVNVTITKSTTKTFVQTDKYLYKPGQVVNLRILSLGGPYLKVSKDPYKMLYVETPSRARIQQWRDVENPTGLVHMSFKLDEESEEGIYNIHLENVHGTITNFKVKDYVLPRFEVTIEPQGVILGSDEEIKIKLCAKYTFGESINGKAYLSVTVGAYDRIYANITNTGDIFGCTIFNYDTSMLRFDENNCHIRVSNIHAYAKIIETGTGNEILKEKRNIRVHRSVIKFKELTPTSREKKFLPEYKKFQALFQDDTPASNEPLDVCYTFNGEDLCKEFITNSGGFIEFISSQSIVLFSMTITATAYPRIESNFNDVMRKSSYRVENYWSDRYSDRHRASLTIYYTESESLDCKSGEELSFTIPVIYISQGNNDTVVELRIQVLSRGQVQANSKHRVQLKNTPMPFDDIPYLLKEDDIPSDVVIGKVDIPLIVPNTVAPYVEIVVWYAKSDGSVIADNRQIDMTFCSSHKVDMSWSTSKANPGSSAALRLKGEPGALCSVGVVDKSVELLAKPEFIISENRLSDQASSYDVSHWDGMNHVTLEYCLKKYNKSLEFELADLPLDTPVSDMNHRKKRAYYGGYDTEMEAFLVFKKAGFFVISNLDLESEHCEEIIQSELKRKILTLQRDQSSSDSGHFIMPYSYDLTNSYGADMDRMAPHHIVHDYDIVTHARPEEATRERAYFPETWLWELTDLSPTTGEATKTLTLPDTITEWVGKAVCLHSDKGIGLSPTASITTFTSFFVDLTLPPNIKRGEILPVKISVFNYLDHQLPVKLVLERSNEYVMEPEYENGVRTLCLPPGRQVTEIIKLRATAIGDVNITVEAATDASQACGPSNPPHKSDRIVRSIPVEAEGFIREKTFSNYVCHQDVKTNPAISFSMEAPEEAVPDSERGYVTVIGDLLGPSMKNLNRLVALPFGCGEQNLIRFVPNIYIHKYARAINAVTNNMDDISSKTIQNMHIGYQRQLSFRRSSGSFSTFGNFDDSGSTWLTAFVVKSFSQAKEYIAIDQGVMNDTLDWLLQRQGEDGCFELRGKIVNKRMLGGIGERTGILTAYVLIALVEAGYKDSDHVKNGVSCILSVSSTHPYDIALEAYSLSLAGAKEAKAAVDKLVRAAIETDSEMRWAIPEGGNNALEIETASYGLLAVLSNDADDHLIQCRKIVRWLASKRNSLGGFTSTQDTVMALQALATFEEKQPGSELDLSVESKFTAEVGVGQLKLFVTKLNKFLEQRLPVMAIPSYWDINLTGTGCAHIQGVLRYNVLAAKGDDAFDLSVDISPVEEDCTSRILNICAAYTLADGKSNMAVIEATMLTGYSPVKEDLKAITFLPSSSVKRFEINGGVVNLYLDEVTSEETCVSFTIRRDMAIGNVKDRHIKVYDYYQPELLKEHTYNFDTSDCS